MSFLPANYESPKQSNCYMKFRDGDNRIRILTRPVMGWEDWQDKTPVRYTFDNKPVKPIDPRKPVRHFWAFVVYNYIENKVQILNITQATIRKALESLCRDTGWGDPYLYDIKINKSREGKDTEYTVNPVPHKAVDQFIIDLFNENHCNLEALFTNEDPFASHWDTFTQLGIDEKKAEIDVKKPIKTDKKPEFITQEQSFGLTVLLGTCEPEYVKKLWKTLADQGINSMSYLPVTLYDRVRVAIQNNQKKGENDIDALFPLSSDEMAV